MAACTGTNRLAYRLAVFVVRCQHDLTPSYFSAELRRVSDIDSRQRLRTLSTTALIVPRTQHSTIGDHAFPVAAAHVWNSLSPAVISSLSLKAFKLNLKTEPFTRSYNPADTV